MTSRLFNRHEPGQNAGRIVRANCVSGGFLSRPHLSRNRRLRGPRTSINERIRDREVRVDYDADKQMDIFKRYEAIKMTRERQADLVEVDKNITPPFCCLVNYGKLL